VLGAHLSPYSILQQAIGHFAVLIFFVHTALVLLFSLERLSLTNGWVPRFYVQRAFRIYPLSVACVLLSLAFRIAWPALIFEPRSTLSVGANLLLVQNLLHEQSSISAPLWSLPFEIQMYAVLPVVFWTIRKYHKQGALLVLATGFVVAIGEKLLHDDVWLAQFVPVLFGRSTCLCLAGSEQADSMVGMALLYRRLGPFVRPIWVRNSGGDGWLVGFACAWHADPACAGCAGELAIEGGSPGCPVFVWHLLIACAFDLAVLPKINRC